MSRHDVDSLPALGLTIEVHAKDHDFIVDRRNMLIGEVFRSARGTWKWIRWGPVGSQSGVAPDASAAYEALIATFR